MKKYFKWMMLLFIPLFTLTFQSCGDDDDDTPVGDAALIIGKWGHEGNETGDYITTTIDFLTNGKAVIEEKFRDYPEDNYKVTVSYTVTGDLTEGADLFMTGLTADGENYSQKYIATVADRTLTMVGVGGEGDGERLVLTKM